ncbi:MAG: hypothetical protein O7D93_07010 [Acidobacteria bacterium]|nr:hypothetical protein [Acidobacteriota bacterium]
MADMKRLLVCSLLVLFSLGTVLWAQDYWVWADNPDDFWAAAQEQLYSHVGTLGNDAFVGETKLVMDWESPALVGQLILIESRDHPNREIRKVMHVLGDSLILSEKLEFDYLAGSRLYQLANR